MGRSFAEQDPFDKLRAGSSTGSGQGRVLQAYQAEGSAFIGEAITHRYRFYSFGDAMLIQ